VRGSVQGLGLGEKSSGTKIYLSTETSKGPSRSGVIASTVGSSGRVAGEVVAREVVVYGAIDGDVRARDRIEVKKAGSLTGDLTTARTVIEDGAYFKGHIEIGTALQIVAFSDEHASE
jgi:cytoskeletal protein CcmA (bactofilin family)